MENGNGGIDLLDILLDSDNHDPIVLSDDAGKQLEFEQVAVIPYRKGEEKALYCVLKPLSEIEGVADDEAIVFYVDTDENGNSIVRIEEDEEIALEVFKRYHLLLEEARANADNDNKD